MALIAERTAGDQTVQMNMLGQGLSPGVQHRGHAHPPIQALGVTAKGPQGVPGTLKQQPLNAPRMQPHPGVEQVGQGKHQMVTPCVRIVVASNFQ